MKNQTGQALVTLLVFVTVATTVIAAAAAITIINLQTGSKFFLGDNALDVAESGAEEALTRLQRDPSYIGDGDFPVGNYSAVITVTGTNPVTVTSVGTVDQIKRTVQVVVSSTNGQYTVTSWQEI